MGLFEVLKQSAVKLDRDAFVARHRGFFLLGYFREHDSSLLGFNTGKLPALPDLEATGATQLHPRLWRLEKSDRNTWRSHISVGRAKNNDVVIRDRGISKLHAHFYVPEEAAESLQIVDIGSENGTEVNGETLPQDVPRLVTAGAEIVFGGTACQLHTAASLIPLFR